MNSLVKLSRIFGICEAASCRVPIESYSVSQNTLDNVFVSFVKNQGDANEKLKIHSEWSTEIDWLDDYISVNAPDLEMSPLT